MGRKKADETQGTAKPSKQKLSVSAMLASMDQNPDKPKKGSSSTAVNKPKTKSTPRQSSYTDDIDLPPSDDEDDYASDEGQQNAVSCSDKRSSHRSELKPLEVSISEKEMKKRIEKDQLAAYTADKAKKEALKDDRDAFTVVIGSRTSVLEGENDADANVKDITVENFFVAARGKDLLKNASVKISHGKRYGLIGPNGKGKSTLLKLLAWRKIPVPKNIDVLLVEQEVVGDDRTALNAVVSANEELVKLRQEVTLLQNTMASSGDGDEIDDDADIGEKLTELYEKLQVMGSDAAEAQASKILAGL
ncbi:Atp-binding cassette sub-family f member, partial [Thalictrum thalictroides]